MLQRRPTAPDLIWAAALTTIIDGSETITRDLLESIPGRPRRSVRRAWRRLTGSGTGPSAGAGRCRSRCPRSWTKPWTPTSDGWPRRTGIHDGCCSGQHGGVDVEV